MCRHAAICLNNAEYGYRALPALQAETNDDDRQIKDHALNALNGIMITDKEAWIWFLTESLPCETIKPCTAMETAA